MLTGQEKHYWVYPQNRYGHDPDEIKYRFPRQTVVYVSPHDDKIVYQASHVLHRSTDDGVTWETISPDLTAHEAAVSRSCPARRSRATSPAKRSTRRSTRWSSRGSRRA